MNERDLWDWRFEQFRAKCKALRAELKANPKRKKELAARLPALWDEAREIYRSSLIAL